MWSFFFLCVVHSTHARRTGSVLVGLSPGSRCSLSRLLRYPLPAERSGSVRIPDAPHGIRACEPRGSTETPTPCSFEQGWLCSPPAGGWPHAAQVGGKASMALLAHRKLSGTRGRWVFRCVDVDVCCSFNRTPRTSRTAAALFMFLFFSEGA